jgi:WhiB family redox-sensing transcriptional regulator
MSEVPRLPEQREVEDPVDAIGPIPAWLDADVNPHKWAISVLDNKRLEFDGKEVALYPRHLRALDCLFETPEPVSLYEIATRAYPVFRNYKWEWGRDVVMELSAALFPKPGMQLVHLATQFAGYKYCILDKRVRFRDMRQLTETQMAEAQFKESGAELDVLAEGGWSFLSEVSWTAVAPYSAPLSPVEVETVLGRSFLLGGPPDERVKSAVWRYYANGRTWKPTDKEQQQVQDTRHSETDVLFSGVTLGVISQRVRDREKQYPSEHWEDRALCGESEIDIDIFRQEDPSPSDIRLAKMVCRQCLVQEECLGAALKTDEHRGIWGGRTNKERVAIQSVRAASRQRRRAEPTTGV